MSCHSLLAWRVSIDSSAVIFMRIPFCVIYCLSLAAFNICSLCLIFANLINTCHGVFHLGFILFGTLGFLDLCNYFLPHSREVFSYFLLEYFLMAFLLPSCSGTPVIQMLGHFTFFQRSLRLSLFLLILLSFFPPLLHLFPTFYLPSIFMVLLNQPYLNTAKTIDLTIQTFVGEVVSTLFDT